MRRAGQEPVFFAVASLLKLEVDVVFFDHLDLLRLALVIIRVAETRTGPTRRSIRAELGTIRQGHLRSRDGEFTRTTELTASQRDLHRALEIPEPPRFGQITPA